MKKPKRIFKERRKPGYVRPAPPGVAHYDPNDLRFITVHEAGHAVMTVLLGLQLISVDIKRRRMNDGRISVGWTNTGRIRCDELDGKGEVVAMPRLMQCVAGPLAEMLLNDRAIKDGSEQGDFATARLIAAVAICGTQANADGHPEVRSNEFERHSDRIKAAYESAITEADRLIVANRRAILSVAEALMERHELKGDEVRAIVKQHPPQPA
jgi:hypothetical protein